MNKIISRRTFLKATLTSTVGVSTAGVSGYYYGTQIEPYDIDFTDLDIVHAHYHLPKAFDGFTIAHISDLHMGGWISREILETVVEKVNALKADMIVITGDFAQHRRVAGALQMIPILKSLKAANGVYGCLGNHDTWRGREGLLEALEKAGVNILLNSNITLSRGMDKLYVAGVGDILKQTHHLIWALSGIPHGAYTILLAHEPDYARRVALNGRVALQLSGHSHGGQVRLPGVGALVTPTYGRRYDMGLYEIDPLMLYVNRGVGMVAPYIRINCNPEITLLKLVAA